MHRFPQIKNYGKSKSVDSFLCLTQKKYLSLTAPFRKRD